MEEERKETTQEPTISFDANSDSPLPTEKSPNPKRFPWKAVLIAATVLCAILITLCATHVICLSHDWQPATCTEPETCSKCKRTKGEPLGHKWEDATCTEPETCSRCKQTKGEPLGHKWENATCTKPQICSVCKAEKGSALGHVWSEATCTSPRRCIRCGTTSGEPLGHSASDWEVDTPATLTQDGTMVKTCTRCGEVMDTESYSKEPEVTSSGFNFTSDEIITYLQKRISNAYTISSTGTPLDDGSSFITYPVRGKDDTALILTKVDSTGNVIALATASNSYELAVSLGAWIAEKIDSSFDTDACFKSVVLSNEYTGAGMQVITGELVDSLHMAVITPAN